MKVLYVKVKYEQNLIIKYKNIYSAELHFKCHNNKSVTRGERDLTNLSF